MPYGVVVLVTAAVFVWGALSARLERSDLTAPIVFVGCGVLLHAVAPLPTPLETDTVKALTEVTLAWVLFSDASHVEPAELRADASIYLRLLGLALPATVVLGWLLAWGVLPDTDVWLALLVGAALAPTDAALSAAVLTNDDVPVRTRSILNVESGLNDGIVTPVVVVAIAGAAAASGGHGGVGKAVLELVVGVAVGAAVGLAGGWLLRSTRDRGWLDEDFAGPAVLALPLLAYGASLGCHGNGFVAAFVAGILFGRVSGRAGPSEVAYVSETSKLASLIVWLLVGAVAVPIAWHAESWWVLLYAVLSLTALRMVPVLLVLLGTGLGRRTSLFIGWFGPRGLASVVFALLAVEELEGVADTAVTVIATTVLLSVVAHGLSSVPLAARYAARSHGQPAGSPAAVGEGVHGDGH